MTSPFPKVHTCVFLLHLPSYTSWTKYCWAGRLMITLWSMRSCTEKRLFWARPIRDIVKIYIQLHWLNLPWLCCSVSPSSWSGFFFVTKTHLELSCCSQHFCNIQLCPASLRGQDVCFSSDCELSPLLSSWPYTQGGAPLLWSLWESPTNTIVMLVVRYCMRS